MKKIPQDIDKLMWLIADQGDLRAVDDFEERFPEHKYELARRMTLVRNLRGAKSSTPVEVSRRGIPQFTPRPEQQPFLPRPVMLAAATVALAAFAMGSYFATRSFVGDAKPSAPPAVPVANTQPLETTHGGNRPVVRDNNSTVPNNGRPNIEAPPRTQPKLVTLMLQSVGLKEALQLIEAEAGINFEIGPGLEDQKIDLNYRNVPINDVLEDLGRRYHFSALDQGEGKFLVIPTRDSKASTSGSSTTGGAGGGIEQFPLYGGNE